MTTTIFTGCCRSILSTLASGSAQTCITSPPYHLQRDYERPGQIGQESTVDEYVAALIAVFEQVKRVLRDDGTLWINIADSYRDKQLAGVPWRLAFALQERGWLWRQTVVWDKPNAMPSSVTDRCSTSHEYVLLFAKQSRYHFDHAAIREPAVKGHAGSRFDAGKTAAHQQGRAQQGERADDGRRSKRSVWSVPTVPLHECHLAAFPPELIEPCVLAGCPEGETIIDPFFGAGTTGLVAARHGRHCIGIELNGSYVEIARKRLEADGGMFADVVLAA